MSDQPVVIIGAGIGGLSAAIHLAVAGQRVIVYEQNAQVGGKMSELRDAGFRWDTGPSIITMRPVFAQVFAAAGRHIDDYLPLRRVDPLTRYFYPDGTMLDASADLPHMLDQIAGLEPRDVNGYLRYLAYVSELHRITGPVFIYDQPPGLASFTRVNPLDALRVDGLRSMHSAIASHVRHPHLRQLLGRFATYVGASPYRAPATLNVIGHVELNQGIWYPERGGLYAVAAAFQRLARELGVEIHTSTPVAAIALRGGRVSGVRLPGGAEQGAKAVIANVDVATVFERLLPAEPRFARQAARLAAAEPSCSGYALMLGVRGQSPDLAHHNIFFSGDYPAEFTDIFDRERPPGDPTVYVAITSKANREDAPPGHENWFVLVNAPALSAHFDWQAEAPAYRERVLDTLARHGHDLRGRIVAEHALTPVDIQRLTGARRGALYGLSSNNRWAAFMRPHNRSRLVPGLYFAGGTTHPGGGVPMVALSGRAAAGLLLDDLPARQHA